MDLMRAAITDSVPHLVLGRVARANLCRADDSDRAGVRAARFIFPLRIYGRVCQVNPRKAVL